MVLHLASRPAGDTGAEPHRWDPGGRRLRPAARAGPGRRAGGSCAAARARGALRVARDLRQPHRAGPGSSTTRRGLPPTQRQPLQARHGDERWGVDARAAGGVAQPTRTRLGGLRGLRRSWCRPLNEGPVVGLDGVVVGWSVGGVQLHGRDGTPGTDARSVVVAVGPYSRSHSSRTWRSSSKLSTGSGQAALLMFWLLRTRACRNPCNISAAAVPVPGSRRDARAERRRS